MLHYILQHLTTLRVGWHLTVGLEKKKSAYEQHVTATLDNTPYITINSLLEWEQNTWNNSYIFRKKKSQNYIFSSVQNKMLHG